MLLNKPDMPIFSVIFMEYCPCNIIHERVKQLQSLNQKENYKFLFLIIYVDLFDLIIRLVDQRIALSTKQVFQISKILFLSLINFLLHVNSCFSPLIKNHVGGLFNIFCIKRVENSNRGT